MSDNPMQIVVAAFNDEQTANAALKALKRAKRDGLIDIKDAAVLRRDAKNKLHIKEIGDMGGGKGSVLGGITGGVIGLLAGPVVLLGAVGALVGGLAAKLRDSGFSNKRLQQLGDSLKPGSSAIIAVVEHVWVAAVEKALQEQAADIFTQQISADVAAQLEAGKDVAFTAIASQSGLVAGRVAADEETVELSGLAVTEAGVVMADAVISSTEAETGDTPELERE